MLHVRLGVLDPGCLSPVSEFHFLKFQELGQMHENQVFLHQDRPCVPVPDAELPCRSNLL